MIHETQRPGLSQHRMVSPLRAPGSPTANGAYLIISGPANGGPLEKETFGQNFSVWIWSGVGTENPGLLIDDVAPYAIRPEGIDLILVNGQWRVLFVEDRFEAEGYATRNIVHWPLTILGNVL